MKNVFSNLWNKSTQVRKQRKFAFNAPIHIKRKFLGALLDKSLRKTYGIRTISLKKGDKVRVLRGQFKGIEGLIEKIDVGRTRVNINGVQITKKDGSKSFYPVHPSNLMIIELNLEDKKRLKQNGKKSQ